MFFLVPLLDGILVILCAKVAPQRCLLGAIWDTFLGPVGTSFILEVDGTLKSNFLGVVFDACLGSGLEDDILMEFDDFGLHLGVPGETILGHLLEIN